MKMITLNMVERNAYSENEDGVVVLHSTPVVIQVESIRCYYKRNDARPGTRITFTDGGGFAVADSVEQVTAAIVGQGVSVAPAPVLAPLAIAAPVAGLDSDGEAEIADIESTQH